MTFTTAFLAASLVVPSMPPPEYDDCEVVTNCVFDASRSDARVVSVKIELDAMPSNGVAVVFGRDTDGDGILSRTEETMSIGCDCGEWNVVSLVTGDKFPCAGASGRVAFRCSAVDATRSKATDSSLSIRLSKTNLTDAAWTCPTNAAHRFFKVKVEMP